MISELMRLLKLKNENYMSRGVLNSDMKIDQESVGWWCQMMVRPGSAAHAALVGGQRRCGWAQSGPPISSLGLCA
eukprot:COSAG02_NODE_4657_length_5125_cov_10.220653_5_plen_75_part_00